MYLTPEVFSIFQKNFLFFCNRLGPAFVIGVKGEPDRTKKAPDQRQAFQHESRKGEKT